jgi:hypothetical protein
MPRGLPQPCWCGSGRLSAECHDVRATQTTIPQNALARTARKLGRHRACMHFAASKDNCSQAIVDAHTVQRSRELRQLIDAENRASTFDSATRDPDGQSTVTAVGWKQASTFAGFCGKHDAATFAPVETRVFDGAAEQCLLLAYRSVCYELHAKQGVARANPSMQSLIDRGRSDAMQRDLQAMHRVAADGNAKGIEHFSTLKRSMEVALANADYRGWHSTVIWFSGPLSLATSGVISPNRDFDGIELQRLHERMSNQESMCCNIVAVDGGGAVALTWPSQASAPSRFVTRLVRDRQSILPLLVQFIFRHVHNVYFSRTWWDSLRPAQKVFLRRLASLSSPEAYYAPLDFRPHSAVVPWELLRVSSTGHEATPDDPEAV